MHLDEAVHLRRDLLGRAVLVNRAVRAGRVVGQLLVAAVLQLRSGRATELIGAVDVLLGPGEQGVKLADH